MREFVDRGPARDDAMTPPQPEQVLEIAKWPEQEQVWDIGRWDEVTRAESRSPFFHADSDEPDQASTQDDTDQDASSPRQPRFSQEVTRSGNNNTMIFAGVVVGLLIVVGGLYAYWTHTASTPALESVAMKAPVQDSVAPVQPVAEPAAPLPSPSPALRASPPPVPPEAVSSMPRRAASSATGITYNATGAAISMRPLPSDDPLNAPMTLTPQTAPPPQPLAPAGQTAMQQPIAAPLQQSAPTDRTASGGSPLNAPMTLTPQTAPPPQQAAPAGPAQPARAQ